MAAVSTNEGGADDVWRELSARTIFLHQAIADHFGLGITDHKCLDILVHNGPMTAGRLAEASNLTTGAITGVVDRLEKKGFVRRCADASDRRKTLVVVQPGRLGEIEKLFGELAARTRDLMSSYSEAEQRAINDFARRSSDLVGDFVARLRQQG